MLALVFTLALTSHTVSCLALITRLHVVKTFEAAMDDLEKTSAYMTQSESIRAVDILLKRVNTREIETTIEERIRLVTFLLSKQTKDGEVKWKQ